MVQVTVKLPLPPGAAFTAFTERFFDWWPRDYSYGGEVVENLVIGRGLGEMCSEIGPSGFQIDFGRVLEWSPPHRLTISWQISPDSRPEPDPTKASRVQVEFATVGTETEVRLTHDQFAKHGQGADEYAAEMGSQLGWPHIMDRFAAFASGELSEASPPTLS